MFAGNHGNHRSIHSHGAGTLRSLRGPLRSGNAHGAAVRTGARLRTGKIRPFFPGAISEFAEELCRAAYAAAIRFAADREAGWAADLPEARRFAPHRRAQ